MRKTNIRLTRRQYRDFAEATKRIKLGLKVGTPAQMPDEWAHYSPWALLVRDDVRQDNPQGSESALITIVVELDPALVRAAGAMRPELDWGKLHDAEVYPFMLQHEIGHRLDNFDTLRLLGMQASETRDRCQRQISYVNEVLADRFAWQQIRPGAPMPLSKRGEREQEQLAESLSFLGRHADRTPAPKKTLTAGQYRDVPDDMLHPEFVEFVGPSVSRVLLERRAEALLSYRERMERRSIADFQCRYGPQQVSL